MGASAESRVGFWLRLVALLIDSVVMTVGGMLLGAVAGGVLGSVFGGLAGATGGTETAAEGAQLGGIFGSITGSMIGIAVFGTLYSLLEGFLGAAVGKMLIGIKIGNADGTTAGIGKLLLRYILKNISYLFYLLAGLVGAMLIANVGAVLGLLWFLGCFLVLAKKKQGLHDMIAGTAVYPRKVLS